MQKQESSRMFTFITKGKVIEDKGYILVLCPNHSHKKHGNYIYEHRLVMEKHLGRELRPEEVIHHINGDKTDNRIENLQLFSNDSEHHIHEWKQGAYNPQPKFGKEFRQKVVDFVRQGHTYLDAVRKFGVSYNIVKGWCLEKSIKSGKSWRSKEEHETVRAWYGQGFSYREISAKTGLSIGVISKWLKKMGKEKYSRRLEQ